MEEGELLHSLANLLCESGVTSNEAVEGKLESLVDLARSGDGRQKLATVNAVPVLLALSPHFLPTAGGTSGGFNLNLRSLVLYVKLLRNLCAGNSINQQALVASKGLDVFVPVANILAQAYFAPNDDTTLVQSSTIGALQMMLQLLGNVAGLGELSQARVWECFFPGIFGSLAKIPSEKIQGPLCMVLFTCCRECDSRCTELSQGRGASLVAMLLSGCFLGNPVNEWLGLLVDSLCRKKPFFPILFCELGHPIASSTCTNGSSQTSGVIDLCSNLDRPTFTREQAILLDILNASLSALEEENHREEPSPNVEVSSLLEKFMHLTSAAFLVDIIRYTANCAASTSLSVLTLPTNSPVADVLGLSLSMTRILCALDEERSTIVPTLAQNGLIPLMLDLLRALGPPNNAKSTISSNSDQNLVNSDLTNTSGNDKSTNQELDEQFSNLLQKFEGFPRKNVYIGYRRDIVAVIANMSHRRFLIQEEVREKEGLLVVLQQCMLDNNNPYLREWGLWAIRNLLEGNTQNQSELADLEVRSAVGDSRLKDAGVSVEINPETGRPRLVNSIASASSSPVDEFM